VYSESIRDRLDLWKIGAAFDIPLRCENSRLFNALSKSLLQASERDRERVRASEKGEVVHECVAQVEAE